MPMGRCVHGWLKILLSVMNKPVFIKLGGSVLTNKNEPEALASTTLHQVIATLSSFHQDHPTMPLVLGHGGGSFGHYWAQRYNTAAGIQTSADWWGVVRVADAMARLNRAVIEACIEHNLPAVSMQPGAIAYAQAGAIVDMQLEPLRQLLQAGMVPVVYGDVLVDQGQGCCIASTETIFAALVPQLQPQRIILVGEQAVFTADPRHNPQAQPIPLIDQTNYAQVLEQLGGSHGIDVTGGMRTKVAQMWQLAQQTQLDVVICGPAALQAALLQHPLPIGTIVSP